MQKIIGRGIVGILALAGILYLQTLFVDNDSIKSLASSGGYFGVFGVSFLNSFNFILPFLTATLMPTWVGAGLEFAQVLLWIVAASTAVDVGMFLVGKYSRRMFTRESRILARLEKLRERNLVLPLVALFFWVLFMPLPNELITIPIGILGYKLLPVAFIVFIGNIAFNGFIAMKSMEIVG